MPGNINYLNCGEKLLLMLLKYRTQGLNIWLKRNACDCNEDQKFHRVIIFKQFSAPFILCFAENAPCCAYVQTSTFDQIINALADFKLENFQLINAGSAIIEHSEVSKFKPLFGRVLGCSPCVL